jgi:Zn-dependent peptidase ImmA (M78 family)
MANTIQLGTPDGIQLELKLDHKKKGGAGLIWGKGQLYAGEQALLAVENQGSVEWTWVDLLEWLGKNWAYLLCEQTFPFQVAASDMSTLMRELEKRWEDMLETRVEDEEEQAHRFFNRHDLAAAFKGVFFPAVFIMRQGLLVEIIRAESNKPLRLPLSKVVTDLEQIGNHLAELAGVASEGRGPAAASQWQARTQQLEHKALSLLTGLSAADLKHLNADNDPSFWEQGQTAHFADSELMAAARMTRGVLPLEAQSQLIERIRQLPKFNTVELDALVQAFAADFKEIGKPYDQGYWAAIWLRRKLGLQEADKAQPAEYLQAWGVQIEHFEMPGSKLAALACWGTQHGPAILINKAPDNVPAHIHGENTTLAHEICHLLMDRSRALPVAEVLNGNTPERLEKRARAFAAEFLLPRAGAATVVRHATTLQAAVSELSDTYAVSQELVCWQIINSENCTSLAEQEQHWLYSQVARLS